MHNALVDTLVIENKDITPQARLICDLGAESIDGLNTLFNLERSLNIRKEEQQDKILLKENPRNPEDEGNKTILELAQQAYGWLK